MKYKLISGPHVHSGHSSIGIMYLVLLALVPAALFGVYIYGLPALGLIFVACASAWLAELICLKARSMSTAISFDGSAFLTGMLLAMSLPASLPCWMVALGSAFAIVIGKHVYGGLGHNLFNPAMLARVMLLICFPVEMITWLQPSVPEMTEAGLAVTDQWLGIDAITAATPLGLLHEPIGDSSIITLLFGTHAGSLGETSALLVLAGGLFLMFMRVIQWIIPTAVILGIVIPALLMSWFSEVPVLPVSVHLLSGATLLVAFFIATDYVTSPTGPKGQFIYGLSTGILIFLIRTFGNFPEGAAFAVLIMNSVTPVIDHYVRPAMFGDNRPAKTEAV